MSRSEATWPPTRFGRYLVADTHPIGRGGFGEVYKAHDPRFLKPVAVKVLVPPAKPAGTSAAHSPEHERWLAHCIAFEAEAQLMRDIQGPLLVIVYDLGRQADPIYGEVPYFVMELAERGTLRDRLNQLGRRLTINELQALITALAAAMRTLAMPRAGYPNGIVHRDLKDTNVLIRLRPGARREPAGELLATNEELVITDLGLAKPIDPDAGLTSSGATRLYCAPEQLDQDGAVDTRADIFAATALVVMAFTDTPPSHRYLPGQPLFSDVTLASTGRLEGELRRGLAPERTDRHQTVDEWETALLDAIHRTPLLPSSIQARLNAPLSPPPVAAPTPLATAAERETQPKPRQRRLQSLLLDGATAAALIAIALISWAALDRDLTASPDTTTRTPTTTTTTATTSTSTTDPANANPPLPDTQPPLDTPLTQPPTPSTRITTEPAVTANPISPAPSPSAASTPTAGPDPNLYSELIVCPDTKFGERPDFWFAQPDETDGYRNDIYNCQTVRLTQPTSKDERNRNASFKINLALCWFDQLAVDYGSDGDIDVTLTSRTPTTCPADVLTFKSDDDGSASVTLTATRNDGGIIAYRVIGHRD